MTRVSQVMSRGVRALGPNDTMAQAARAMAALDTGVIPICEEGRLVGIVTDRDLVLRGLALDLPGDSTPLSEVMSGGTTWCEEDQSISAALTRMRSAQIRRLPVIDREGQLIGMLSLGDVAVRFGDMSAGEVLSDISSSPPSAKSLAPRSAL